MPTFNGAVAANADDAQEKADGSGFSATDVEMDCIASSVSESTRSFVGLRFPNVTIPVGATVNQAYITINVSNPANSDDPDLFIYANAVDDANNFSDEPDVVSRALTTANVAWNEGNIGHGIQNSPELKSVIQEWVNRPGRVSGDALCIILVGRQSLTGRLRFEAYDNVLSTPATITIVYTEQSTSSLVIINSQPIFDGNIFDANIFHVDGGGPGGPGHKGKKPPKGHLGFIHWPYSIGHEGEEVY